MKQNYVNAVNTKRIRRLCFIIIITSLALLILLNILGYLANCKYISVLAAMSEVNKYEVRNELLLDALDSVGTCDPEDTAAVWAKGLIRRSAALQYSAMDKQLREFYKDNLEETAPNWVTGMSSPWVDKVRIDNSYAKSENCYVIELTISTATSTGPADTYNAVLTLKKIGAFWRIINITADEGLNAYTGFKD